jgi:hypothetical protein
MEAVRMALRDTGSTRQAGFGEAGREAEFIA